MTSTHFDLDDFAAALRRAMADRNVGVAELADLLDVSRQSVSAWRRAKSAPAIRRVGDIERALGLQRGELAQQLIPELDPPSASERSATPAGYDARISQLPEHVRRTIDDLIDQYEAGRD